MIKLLEITKYNPKFRDEDGAYIPEEWTGRHQIGQKFDGTVLTEKNYLEIEDKYVQAAQAFAISTNQSKFTISSTEIHDRSEFRKHRIPRDFIKNGRTFDYMYLSLFIRLALRDITYYKIRFGNFAAMWILDEMYMMVRDNRPGGVDPDAFNLNDLFYRDVSDRVVDELYSI